MSDNTDEKKEIKQLHKQFYEEAPLGFIPKNDFGQLTELMGIKDEFITSLVRVLCTPT
jgi:hypothetical protein